MNKDLKEIREYIACPQFGDDHYGGWGALRLDQRIKIKQLLDYITNLQEENERLKEYRESYRKELDFWRIQFSNKEERINKAIEKLENMKNIEGGTNSTILQVIKEVEETVSILRGEDNEQ